MQLTAPHYLLLTESAASYPQHAPPSGHWRFVLEQIDGEDRVEITDRERNVTGERLELLAIVRGLEALAQPSRVTLVTASKYAGRRIRQGLTQWRENDWQWERFGEYSLVKHHDLWRRIDTAMDFHKIECRIWQWSSAMQNLAQAVATPALSGVDTEACIETSAEPSSPLIEQSDYFAYRTPSPNRFTPPNRKSWSQVTEIDPDVAPRSFPQAYGCTAN